jgi:hypothetical protein
MAERPQQFVLRLLGVTVGCQTEGDVEGTRKARGANGIKE